MSDRHVATAPARAAVQTDQRFLVHNVSWEQYVALRELFDDGHPGLHMTYLEGTLELMSPSQRHETVKKMFARLIEMYVFCKNLDLNGYGEMTFRKRAKQRGLEPDECYCIGPIDKAPDIAFEVLVTTHLLDKLSVYAGLEVPEVWIWQDGRIRIHALTGDHYEERPRSRFLPKLDPATLLPYIERDDQSLAVREFANSLRR